MLTLGVAGNFFEHSEKVNKFVKAKYVISGIFGQRGLRVRTFGDLARAYPFLTSKVAYFAPETEGFSECTGSIFKSWPKNTIKSFYL